MFVFEWIFFTDLLHDHVISDCILSAERGNVAAELGVIGIAAQHVGDLSIGRFSDAPQTD